MMPRITAAVLAASLFIPAFSPAQAEAPPPRFVQFKPSFTMGALYYPDPAKFPHPHIAVLAMHRDSNFMSHISTQEMPKRGIVAFGMNPRCANAEDKCTPWENNALDVKQGIEFLRGLPGIDTVILIGHSGGGPTMSFYQSIAENGVTLCQQPDKLSKCSDQLAGLPPADGVILMDAHPGNGINAVRALNPAVTNDYAVMNQNAAPNIDPGLDPFNTANGYNPHGESHYSDAFKQRYFKAQSARMNRLIDIATKRMKEIGAGTYRYPDDGPFVIPMGDQTRLLRLDLSIDHSTEKPRKLLKNDGTIQDCCVVNSVRPVSLTPRGDKTFWHGAMFLTLRSFLSVRAIRSQNSMYDIDWCSSNNSTVCDVRHVSVPLLIVAMQGHYFVRDSEIEYENAASKDKDFIIIEGAVHGGTPCTACMPDGKPYDGRYDNAVRNDFDYMAKWINARFSK